MFISNPDPYLLPSYNISPFMTNHIIENYDLPDDDFSVGYFDKKFGKNRWKYTFNGREAIELALQHYQLKEGDLVTILTTSGNFYISSCVTNTIEKFCNWNRELLPETKLIFVNHEFGYPHPEMDKLVATGLPIIEDCCTTFFSQDEKQMVGKYGDFAVYSLPKFFPMRFGGILVSNIDSPTADSRLLNDKQQNLIQKVMSHHLRNEKKLLEKRMHNFDYAISKFSKLGFKLRFPYNEFAYPSVLLLKNKGIVPELNELKAFLTERGIQNSIFYGEDVFFIPCHQSLSEIDIDLIFQTIVYYLVEKI